MKEYIRVPSMSGTVSVKAFHLRVERSPKWYGRIPASVLLDGTLTSDAVRVYGLLALPVLQGNVSSVGMRVVAGILHVSPQTVMRRIRELVAAGHVEISKGTGKGKRAWYLLTSPVFGQKQAADVKEIANGPSGQPRLVSLPRKTVAKGKTA